MNNETFEAIKELRNDNKKWDEIYNDYTDFNLQFKSITVMKTAFTREQARRRTS